MKLTTTMCHSHLMSMLLQPEQLERAVSHYRASTPEVSLEGMSGCMATEVEFEIRSLPEFAQLYQRSQTYPSDRSRWYHTVRQGMLACDQSEQS